MIGKFNTGEIFKDTVKNSLVDDEASIKGTVVVKHNEYKNSKGIIGITMAVGDLTVTSTYAA